MSVRSHRFDGTAGLGRWLQATLGVQAAVLVAAGVATFLHLRSASALIHLDAHGEPIPPDAFPFGVFNLWPLTAASGAIGLVTIVLWLVWQHRATSNLWAAGLPHLRITPGWAIGWWFIPFANLAMPFVAVRELDRRSASEDDRRGGALLGWWWALWLAGTNGMSLAPLGGVFAMFAAIPLDTRRPQTIDLSLTLHAVAPWVLVASLLYAGAAVLALLVVRRIDRGQTGLIERALQPPTRPDIARA